MTNNEFSMAVADYNRICFNLALEHLTIGTKYSQGTEGWNIRDMVAELDYQLTTYREPMHFNYEQLHSADSRERLQAMRECKMLKTFIKKYERYITYIRCVAYHCSKFDK